MRWTKLWFGKHKDKTLPQVLFSDPDWFFHAVETNIFGNKGRLAAEAKEIDKKVRNIRIPDKEGKDLVVEYGLHPSTHKFGDLELVPRNRPKYDGAAITERMDVIDLSYPGKFALYDKGGYKILLSFIKKYLFGGSSYRMTRRRCEAFFDDDGNFKL